MPKVDLIKCGGDINTAMRRLKRLSEKDFLWIAWRAKEYYIKPTTQRRTSKIAAKKRNYKKRFKEEQIRRHMRRSGRY